MPPKHLTLAILLLAFTAHSGDNTITYANKTYKTVQIGEQVWFAENLNYDAEGSVCYGNNPANCAKHGRLYNWETALKVCPEGWHLPSIAEWDKLFRFIDGTKGTESPYRSETAGKHLKAVSGWKKGNGTDTYGFSAMPGGFGYSDGTFGSFGNVDYGSLNVGYYGFWWSASKYENGSNDACYRQVNYDYDYAYWNCSVKSSLLSVRCVKD